MTVGTAQVSAAAIVPAFDEEGRVGAVVRTLVGSGEFSRVLVVSDGSTDRTAEEARSAGAEVLILPENVGKAGAMVRGMARVDDPVVCFFDADLVGLTAEHVRRLIGPVMSGRTAMNVGLCDRNPFYNWLALRLPLLSGQRAMRRDVFESVPAYQMAGYGVELALDRVCRLNRLPISATVLPGLNFVRKTKKIGLLPGMVQYARMTVQLLVWPFLARLGSRNK
ncbi:MAG: glycosyltransferase family 2 protein [bacterium]